MSSELPSLLSSSEDLALLRPFLDLIDNPMFVKDRQQRFVLLNRAACDLLGRAYEDVIGRTDHDLQPREQADVYVANDRLVLETGHPNENEELLTDGEGRVRTLLTRKSLLRRSNGEDFVIVSMTDITEFRNAQAQVHYSAEHDGLTKLANTVMFRRVLSGLLGRTSDDGQSTAVFLINLDGFSNVNYALGRSAGDNLLVQFAQILSAATRPVDLVARLGGDEFAIIQCASGQPVAASAVAASILKRLETPVFFDGRRLHVSATIGIAVARLGEDAEAVLRRADLALRHAKRDGGNRWRFFEADMEARQTTGPFLEEDLRVALQQRQFSIVYQPIARVSDLEILGYEALLRWTHPVLGPIGPSVFIPLAETEGFIVSIGEWVLREACEQAARGPKELGIAVNVSPVQFTRADLLGLVRSVINDTGIDPRRIELEITETSVIGDIERARGIFANLHAMGVRVVLDDFGAGYSSLEVLKSLPFDKVKIDRALLVDVGGTQKGDAIISAILRLMRTLDLPVVAEGVETSEQLAVLQRENCEAFQGFFLSRPVQNPFKDAEAR